METQQDPQQQQLLQQQTLHEDGSTGSSSKSSFLCRQTSTRWTPTTDQIRILKDLYYNNGVRSPSGEQIQRISARLRQYGKIEGKNVFYWFQNHKARERQKKRFTVDMAMQRSGAASSLTFSPTGFSTPSSPSSSPGVLGVGQMGNMGCGSVLMEKSFRDCTISSGGSGMGGSISNNMGWVGVDPYSSSYPFYDKMKSIQTFKEETPEIETLPLFPMHGEDISGFCTGNPDPNGYNTSSYRPDEEKGSTRTSLELSLNSYTGRSPYTD